MGLQQKFYLMAGNMLCCHRSKKGAEKVKRRQRNKILKRAGVKLHNDYPLTGKEKDIMSVRAESVLTSTMHVFHLAEFEAGTIYGKGYVDRMLKVLSEATSIEKLTGVKK
jgi:Flp pilus assembly protein TadD